MATRKKKAGAGFPDKAIPDSLNELDDGKVTTEPKPTGPETSTAKYWITQIDASLKREQDWRAEADRIVGLYEGAKGRDDDSDTYNILYSNTETLGPALYNSTPQPIVKRRFDDPDPLGLEASKAGERIVKYLCDDGMAVEATFDDLMQDAVQNALVPGRGVTRFKYMAEFEKVKSTQVQNDDPNAQVDETDKQEYDRIKSELICGEDIPWDRFCHGYGRRWRDVPWVAYMTPMTREELVDTFGADIGNKVDMGNQKIDDSNPMGMAQVEKDGQGTEVIKMVAVWQIWDKPTRKVYSVTSTYPDALLQELPDPLGLTGMFPGPEPLQLRQRISSLVPNPLYLAYETQARELNEISRRIVKITKALKIRGMYDSTVQGIAKVLEAGDNELIAGDNVAAMLASGTKLEDSIWLMPIDKLITVLQQLYTARDQCKTVIFELTGIADIMRGSTQASETLGAQQLKIQWGGLRMKRQQKRVANYARDSIRMIEEIAVKKLQPQTLRAMTGLPFPLQGEQNHLKQVTTQAQQEAQMQGQPSDIPPEIQALLSAPTWEAVQKLLANDTQRTFRIDIQTNSTLDAEATQDKQDISELLQALSQFLTAVGPLIANQSMPFAVAKSMMLFISRRFRMGQELEEMLQQLQQPTPPPNPDQMKMQLEQQRAGNEIQLSQQQAALDAQGKQQELAHKQSMAKLEMGIKTHEAGLKMAEMTRKDQAAAHQHNLKMEQMATQVAVAHTMPKPTVGKGVS